MAMVRQSTLTIHSRSQASPPLEAEVQRASGEVPAVVVQPLQIGPLRIDPPILQAPMAGFTNFTYRQIVREYGGVGLQATEMVNARGFAWLDEHEAEHPDRLWGVRDEARPLAVQIWDNEPEVMAKVGRRLVEEYRVSVVDINFGCPVKQVTQGTRVPISALPDRMRPSSAAGGSMRADAGDRQIRLGCTRRCDPAEIAQVVEEAGAAADGPRTDGGGVFQGSGRLGADRGHQAASAIDSADRQWRPG